MASIYVGNLPYSATETEIEQLFTDFGKVRSVKIIMDRESGRPRGYAFVDLDTADTRDAIKHVHGK
ncbi:MAG: RNA-binding protein, partial [Pseudomonadota bacterium]